MQDHLLPREPIRCTGLLGKLEMASIAFDTDQMHVQSHTAGSDTSVVDPAAPATTKLHHREALTCQIYGTERRTPFGNVSVPIGRDGDALHLSCTSLQDRWEKFGVNPNTKKVGQVSRRASHTGQGMAADDLLGIEYRVVM